MEESSLPANILRKISDFGIDGSKFLCSAEDLAKEYLYDEKYSDNDARVNSLIRWETSRSFGAGFITGIGGLLALPVTIPASLGASWVVQSRLAGTIARIYGHHCHEDRVRTLVRLCLLGDAAKEAVKRAGIVFSNKLGTVLVSKIPGAIFIEINKKIGFRLLTKAGEKGILNVMKIVPVLGGFVGGTVDAISTRTVGKVSKDIFRSIQPTPDPAPSA